MTSHGTNSPDAPPEPCPDIEPALRDRLLATMRGWRSVTPKRLQALEARFGLTAAWACDLDGVRQRLTALLADGQKPASAEDRDWSSRIAAHRRRQGPVAEIIEAIFGPLAECNPQLWGRRAYCLLVGIIYERLAADEREIDTGELVTLAKVLAETRRCENQATAAEQRTAESNGRAPSRTFDNETTSTDPLPPNFGEIVRRIYGANFDPVEPVPATTRGSR